MKALLFLFAALVLNFSTKAAHADSFCTKISKLDPEKEYSKEELREAQHYSYAERLQQLYKGDKFMLKNEKELIQHQQEVTKAMTQILEYLGYPSITVDQVLYCSNSNSAHIDFNLLRYSLFHGLNKGFYIF